MKIKVFNVLATLCLVSIPNVISGEESTGVQGKFTTEEIDEYHRSTEGYVNLHQPDENYIEYPPWYASNFKANSEFIAFFVWDYKKYPEIISKLLSGQKVTLYSDIKQSDPHYDTFRLTEVQFRFTTSDNSTPSAFNDVLFKFQLESDHLGNSYFRSKGHYYFLKTNKYFIWYSLEDDEEGHPVSRCISYDSIKSFIFSPYASWSLQLYPAADDSPKFPILKQYKEIIQVELMGRGGKLKHKLIKKYCKPINSTELPKH